MPARSKSQKKAKPVSKADLNRHIQELEAEVSALQAEVKSNHKGGTMHSSRFGWKQPVIWLSTIIAVLLVVAGNMFFWAGNTVVKQDRYVEATAPIIKNTNVQHAVALYTTTQIFNNFDVEKFTKDVLPPKADFLAPTLAAQVKSQTQSLLQKALANPKVQDKWNQIQANQHQKIISFIEKYQGNGQITLNDFYNQLSARLASTPLSFLANKTLPAKIGSIKVVNATWLPEAHRVVTHIDLWRNLAILFTVLFLALAMWLSRNRRQVLYTFCVSTIVGMVVTLVGLRVLREQIAGQVNPAYADGVRSAIQIFTHGLWVQSVTIIAAAALIGIVAWLSGQSKSATVVKKQTVGLLSGRLHETVFGESSNKVVIWFQTYKRYVEWALVAVIAIIMLSAQLTPKAILGYAILLLVLIVITEIVGAEPSTTPKTSRSRTSKTKK